MKIKKFRIQFTAKDTKGKLFKIKHLETVFDFTEVDAIRRAFKQLPTDIIRLPVVSAEAFEDRS